MNKIATLLLLCTALFAQQKGTLTDTRDGKTYKTVKIGTQTWMAENLNYEAESSRCYNDSTAYCDKYGRLYNWETAKKVCPSGWHLPTNEEWNILHNFADSINPYESETVGKFLKATSDWEDYKGISGNGEDKFGFSALPGGVCLPNGRFYEVGKFGNWWSSSGYSNNAYGKSVGYNTGFGGIYHIKKNLKSVRCLQNTPAQPKEAPND